MADTIRTTTSGASPFEFPTTVGTLIEAATQGNSAEGEKALGALCVLYRPCILAYFAIKTSNPALAKDLTQAFVVHWLARNPFTKFKIRKNSRFRCFVGRALKNFWIDYQASQHASIRNFGRVPESLEELKMSDGFEVEAEDPSPDPCMDWPWALQIHRCTLARLQAKRAGVGTVDHLELLLPFILREGDRESYAEIGKIIGAQANTVKQQVFRLRREYLDHFRCEVSQTTAREEIVEEMRYLMEILPEALAQESGQT